jgi:N-acetylglucosaminyl-diphospho-decaprenol L-rhamnosyltransferase
VTDTTEPGTSGQTERRSPANQSTSHWRADQAPRKIVFVCINYNSSQLIKELLDSITIQKDRASELLIVNNSPSDTGLADFTTDAGITVLQAERNLGFGGGCNLALGYLQKHDPQVIAWLINPDARLLPGAIKTIRECMSSIRGAAIVGTRILDNDKRIWFDHGRFNKYWGRINHEPIGAKHDLKKTGDVWLQKCAWVSGCSLILDGSRFSEMPRFDEQIFLYYEDTELCLRLGRDGVASFVTKDALVSHSISATTSRDPTGKHRHATFGKLYLLHQHGTPWSIAINLVRYCIRAAVIWPMDHHEAAGRALGVLNYLGWLSTSKTKSIGLFRHQRD